MRGSIESRYSKSYRITEDELRVLGDRVPDFGVRVERACRVASIW